MTTGQASRIIDLAIECLHASLEKGSVEESEINRAFRTTDQDEISDLIDEAQGLVEDAFEAVD